MIKLVVVSILIAGALGAVLKREGASCPLFCHLSPPQPLCGSDGVTYDNKCYFHKAECMDPTLRLAHEGACVSRRGIICTTPMCWPRDDPVCGSDGVTYMNECFLNNAMCENESLKVEYHGPCTPTYR